MKMVVVDGEEEWTSRRCSCVCWWLSEREPKWKGHYSGSESKCIGRDRVAVTIHSFSSISYSFLITLEVVEYVLQLVKWFQTFCFSCISSPVTPMARPYPFRTTVACENDEKASSFVWIFWTKPTNPSLLFEYREHSSCRLNQKDLDSKRDIAFEDILTFEVSNFRHHGEVQ